MPPPPTAVHSINSKALFKMYAVRTDVISCDVLRIPRVLPRDKFDPNDFISDEIMFGDKVACANHAVNAKKQLARIVAAIMDLR
jgi:hypothetical protein